MKKKIVGVLLCFSLILGLMVGCAQNQEDKIQKEESKEAAKSNSAKTETKKEPKEETKEEEKETAQEGRLIRDLSGKEVTIPRAADIQKVVIISPPLAATYVNVVKDTEKLVGLHPSCIRSIHKAILPLVIPNWEDINTKFLKGYTSNTEEVFKMDPDIILVYGDFQNEGLETVDIPIVDFFMKDSHNETWSVSIDSLMREIFEVQADDSLQKEWDEANKIVAKALAKVPKEKRKKGIMVRSNNKESFTVRGGNYYGDDWLIKSGLQNMAGGLEGDSAQVSMEQIYEWNPDVVYDFVGADASQYLEGAIKGQDWSLVEAFKEGAIYDMPRGMFNWGAPNADSPLTLIWMTMKNYPDTIEPSFFNQYMKDFYDRRYGISLTDEMVSAILDPEK